MLTILGLTYLPDYVDTGQQATLLQAIDAAPWRTDLARRTQHYGYVYDYQARKVDASMYLGPLPGRLAELAERFARDGLFAQPPDQAIINEYLPGQGIADHVDCQSCFGPVVVSLSLLSPVVMDFRRGDETVSLLVAPGSLLRLQGEARYTWTHGIAKRKRDRVGGDVIARGRRLSATFRQVLLAPTSGI